MSVIKWGICVKCISHHFSLLIFLPIWEDKKCGPRRELFPLFSVSLIFFPQPNSGKQHFSLYFPLHIFHHPCFYPNQTHPKCLMTLSGPMLQYNTPKLPKTLIGSHVLNMLHSICFNVNIFKIMTNFLKRVFWKTIIFFWFDNDIENELKYFFSI